MTPHPIAELLSKVSTSGWALDLFSHAADDWMAITRFTDFDGRVYLGRGRGDCPYTAILAAQFAVSEDRAKDREPIDPNKMVGVGKPTVTGQALLAQLGLAKPKVQGVVLKGLGT